MPDLRDLNQESYRQATAVPDIIAERCVHALIEIASCQACVDVCPRGAWIIDDEQVGIDANRCDGCNLCVAACPQGAIQADTIPALKSNEEHTMALLACDRAGALSGTGAVPCLHALGLNAMITLYRKGVDSMVCSTADCDTCPRGGAPRLSTRLKEFNRLLRERRMPEMQFLNLDADAWSKLARKESREAEGPSMSRRQFFRRTTRAVISGHENLHVTGAAAGDTFEPAGSIIPSQTAAQLVPFLAQIDPIRCNACDACARLCPHGAIRVEIGDSKEGRAYLITPDLCSGCGICKDVCDQKAVSVSTWATPDLVRIPLSTDHCRSCGATYYTPAGGSPGDRQCRICVLTQNHQLLYQVLD